jgi:hypothetical protein
MRGTVVVVGVVVTVVIGVGGLHAEVELVCRVHVVTCEQTV